MSTWHGWAAVVNWALMGAAAIDCVGYVLLIDSPRKPISKGNAAFLVVINAFLVYWYSGHLR